ncbi:MAG: acyltransferase [Bacteroidetes bacterium]|nr:acyltransferase [Bacteroidota bacterium]
MDPKPKLYFPGLNALRFFAALAVIICHVELIKSAFGLPSLYNTWKIIPELGSLGVYFFFVLSGFLITYLLLQEQSKTKTVSVRKFYMRRILRIWPLYFIIVILGFFILPSFDKLHITYLQKNFTEHFSTNLLLYMLILPNVAFAFFTASPHIGHLWSIGVEEQFYLTWPWLFKRKHHLLKWLWIILVLLIGSKVLFIIYYKTTVPTETLTAIKNLIAMSKFENMAIGGIGAIYLFENKTKVLKWAYKPIIFYLSLVLVPVLVYTPDMLQDGIHIVYSVLFLIIILNVVRLNNVNSFLEKKVFIWLGNLSYGIYMYHMAIIAIVCCTLKYYLIPGNPILMHVITYTLSLLLSIFVSHVSYRYVESFFLRLKERFN